MVALLLPLAFFTIYTSFERLSDFRAVLEGDFIQDYVMGRALLDGQSPYQPVQSLIKFFYGNIKFCSELYISPHTPFTIFIFTFLQSFDVQLLSLIWNGLSIVFLYASLRILFEGSFKHFLILFSLLVLSVPMSFELIYGQSNSLMLFLGSLALYFYSRENKIASAIIIGLLISLKLYAWVFLIYFVFKKDLKLLLISLISALIFSGLPAAFYGKQIFIDYVQIALPDSLSRWIKREAVISIFSIPYKIFYTEAIYYLKDICTPLRIIPDYSAFTKVLAILLLSGSSLFALVKIAAMKGPLKIFSSLLSLSVIVNPISWMHYSIGLVPKLCWSIRELRGSQDKRRPMWVALMSLAVLFTDLNSLVVSSYPEVGFNAVFNLDYIYAVLSVLPTVLIFLIAIL